MIKVGAGIIIAVISVIYMIAFFLCPQTAGKVKRLPGYLWKNLPQIFAIFSLFSLFLLAALINRGSGEALLRNKILSALIIFGTTFLLFAFAFKRIIREAVEGLAYVVNRPVLLAELVIITLSRIWMTGDIQRWDGAEYYYKLGNACRNFLFTPSSYYESFKLCTHGTLGFTLFAAIGEFFFPRNPAGYHIVALFLNFFAMCALFKLLEHYFEKINTYAPYIIVAIVSCLPLFWGTFSYVNTDYWMVFFFIFMIYCHYKKKYIPMTFWAIVIFQTKETGIVLAGGYLAVVSIYLFLKKEGKLLLRVAKIIEDSEIWVTTVTLFAFLGNVIIQGSLFGWEASSKSAGDFDPDRSDYFGISLLNISLKTKQMFYLNFAWIFTLLLLVCIVLCIVKRKKLKLSPLIFEIGTLGGLSFYALFNYFYVTGALYRYMVVWVVFYALIVLIMAFRLLNIKIMTVLSVIVMLLCSLQSFLYIDPVSNLLFRTIDSGQGKKVIVASVAKNQENIYFGDSLIVNYSFNDLNRIYDELLREIDYDSSEDAIMLPGTENAGTHIGGNAHYYRISWNEEEKRRVITPDANEDGELPYYISSINTLSTAGIFEKLPFDGKITLADRSVKLEKHAYVLFLPYYGEDEEATIKGLSKYYEVGERRVIRSNFTDAYYYELNLKSKYLGVNIHSEQVVEDMFTTDGEVNWDNAEKMILYGMARRIFEGNELLDDSFLYDEDDSRRIKENDLVYIYAQAFLEDELLPLSSIGQYSGYVYGISVGSGCLIDGTDKELVGLKKDDVFIKKITVTEDMPLMDRYLGKEIELRIRILNIYGHLGIEDNKSLALRELFALYWFAKGNAVSGKECRDALLMEDFKKIYREADQRYGFGEIKYKWLAGRGSNGWCNEDLLIYSDNANHEEYLTLIVDASQNITIYVDGEYYEEVFLDEETVLYGIKIEYPDKDDAVIEIISDIERKSDANVGISFMAIEETDS